MPITGKVKRRWWWVSALLLVGLLVALIWTGLRMRDPGPVTVVARFPDSATENISSDSRVSVSFNRSVGSSADAFTFSLADAKGELVAATTRFNDLLESAELTPVAPLLPGRYTATASINGLLQKDKWEFTVPEPPALTSGPGGPILLVTSRDDPYDEFYAAILRAEGFTGFESIDSSELTGPILAKHPVVLVSEGAGREADVPLLQKWVRAGGSLVTVRPSGPLASLAGVGPARGTVREGYLTGHQSMPESIQFHGTADIVRAVEDVATVASLSRTSDGTTVGPAITLRSFGSGGHVGTFTFDLAESVILTRQGNPEWAGQERDGSDPIRSNDLFFGGSADKDFLDLDKVSIPQADETMRMLSNLLGDLTQDRHPLPKLWYFPNDARAVLVMAADDHGTETGTRESFDRMREMETANCVVERWECPRATAWIYPSAGLSDEEARAFVDDGFDVGAHVVTRCQNWSKESLDLAFARSLEEFRRTHPSLPAQEGNRLHCIAWSQYVAQPRIERTWGIRFDMNYYYWPASWVKERAGFMTGSGLPMPFSDLNGSLIDVYQQETHLVDEVFAKALDSVEDLIDRALGPEGYYGALGTHYDFHNSFDSDLMKIAKKRDVPMVSAQQMIDWMDGRSASRFKDLRWADDTLTFTAEADERTTGMLRGMLPVSALGGSLIRIERDGKRIDTTVQRIKGVDYAFFDVRNGAYTVTYDIR